jgi:peptide/nickel transport system permease protein
MTTRVATLTLALPRRLFAFRTHNMPLVPVGILIALALMAIFADFIAPYNPEIGILGDRFKPPAWVAGGSEQHLLGTDHLGRDVLSRLIFGARVSLIVGVVGTIVAGGVGTTLGILSGYLGGWVDQAIMRLTDAWLAFPFLILAIGLVTIMGASLTNATVAIGLAATPTYIRLTRGLVLSTREEDYVQAARALGAGGLRTILRHVLPNIVSALLVQATVSIPAAIIAEAILSFLGLGVQPPTPSWGTMLNTAQQFLETAPWMAWWPGLAIFTLTLSFNLAGDGLRDLLDPKDY